MSKTMVRLAVMSALALSSSAVFSLPFNSFDPRSMAMGGAGVAVGDAAMAPFFNPALLSVTNDVDDFSMNIPVVGARVYDPENFQDSFEAFQDGNYVDTLDTSINNFNMTNNSNDLRIVADDGRTLSTQLSTLDSKPIQGEAGVATVIAIPSKRFGGAFFVNGTGALGGMVNYRDDVTLQEFATTLDEVANCYDANVISPGSCIPSNATIANYDKYFDASGNVIFTSSDLDSTVNMRVVGLAEMGMAFATQFGEGAGSWALGITPKKVTVRLYDINMDMKTAENDNFDENDYMAEYSHTNFDIGLAKNFNNGWRTGLVVKNVISHTYDFKNAPRDTNGVIISGAEPVPTGESIALKPLARIGASHQNSWSTVALDVDLTSNDSAGFNEKSRYVALGVELNAWDWIQLRVGYRLNTEDSARNVASAGLGLAIAGTLHVDAAVAANSDETGAALQLGLQF